MFRTLLGNLASLECILNYGRIAVKLFSIVVVSNHEVVKFKRSCSGARKSSISAERVIIAAVVNGNEEIVLALHPMRYQKRT